MGRRRAITVADYVTMTCGKKDARCDHFAITIVGHEAHGIAVERDRAINDKAKVTIGSEGMVGLYIVLGVEASGSKVTCRVAGKALRLPGRLHRERRHRDCPGAGLLGRRKTSGIRLRHEPLETELEKPVHAAKPGD